MEYLCPVCKASEILYQGNLDCCPYCGSTVLYFTHIGFKLPTHRVLLDCKTGKALDLDLCDVLSGRVNLREVNHE